MRINFNIIVLIICLIGSSKMEAQTLWGSGSRDLYPYGIQGNRAWMSSMWCTDCAFNPFPTIGRVMVYAKADEIIYVGSSVQGLNNGEIRLYPPTGVGSGGNKYYTSGTGIAATNGFIANRNQEIVGPNVSFNTNRNNPLYGNSMGYTPYTRTVGSTEAGIWIIEFISKGGAVLNDDAGGISTNIVPVTIKANDEWATNQSTVEANSAFIAAWDVSISNGINFISGRTFITNFSGGMNPNTADQLGINDGFFGKFYVLTKDGFAYKVDNNGQNGLSFNFFVNNKGVVNHKITDPTPTYRSFGSATYSNIVNKIWDPRDFDNETDNHITHKMFYSVPASDMPTTAPLWYWNPARTDGLWDSTGSTGSIRSMWLRPVRINPEMSDLSFIGSEGTLSQSGSKGGFITFTSNVSGFYEIEIPFGGSYVNRVLQGPAVPGVNRVYWDGKDQNGTKVTSGVSLSSITTSIAGAEVHFPMFDVENNPYGLILELLKADFTSLSPKRTTVYWDNSALATTSGTIANFYLSDAHKNNSTTGANSDHIDPATSGNSKYITGNQRWGQINNADNSGTTGKFGNDKTVDTWSYAPGEEETINGIVIDVKQYDLEVVNVLKTAGPDTVSIGNSVTYEVNIKNNGPIAAMGIENAYFFFYVPTGVTINPASVVFTSSNGSVLNGTSTFENLPSGNAYKVRVNIPVGGLGKFTIPVTFSAPTSTPNVNAWGAIMRNIDIGDPNATNTDYINIPFPRDPFEEANGIQQGIENINLNASNIATAFSNLSITDANNDNFTNNIKYNNQVTSTNVASTTLSIVKTGTRTGSTSGTATFTVKVTNTGINASTNTILKDDLAAGRYSFTKNLSTDPATYMVTKGTLAYTLADGVSGKGIITWNIGTLLPNESATIIFNTSVGSTGSQANTASVSSNEATNVNSTVTLSTNTTAVDLGITKAVANHATVANRVVFTIVVRRSSGSSNSIEVSDLLPSGYTYQSHTASPTNASYIPATGLWSVGTLDGTTTSRTLTITADVNTPTGVSNEYLNVARIISSSSPDSSLANNTASAEIKADLQMEKTVNSGNPKKGGFVTFTLKATNFARTDYNHATGVKVVDVLPSGFTFVSNTTPTSGSFNSSTGVWTIGNLTYGANATLTITAKVNSSGSYINTASISGGQKDAFLANNVSTVSVFPKILLITNPMIYQKTE